MRLAYIDESYNADSYWFGAILVPEQADAAMQREILGIPGRYAEHGIAPDTELHGYPLWSGEDAWGALSPRLRVDAMRRTLRTIRRAAADVIFVGIDRRQHALDQLNRARAFAVEKLLQCIEQECTTTFRERCLLIFDEETSTSKELFQVVHDRHRATLLAGNDPQIVERPVIAPSQHTPGIQVADVAVYLRRRQHTIPQEGDPRAQQARDELISSFQDRIGCEQTP